MNLDNSKNAQSAQDYAAKGLNQTGLSGNWWGTTSPYNYPPNYPVYYTMPDYRVDQLQREVADLKEQMAKLKAAFGK